jgi:hypothetical protein
MGDGECRRRYCEERDKQDEILDSGLLAFSRFSRR